MLLDIVLIEKMLPLQVGEVDKVAVDDGEGTNTGPGEGFCESGAESAAADDGTVSLCEKILSLLLDAFEKDLLAITLQ